MNLYNLVRLRQLLARIYYREAERNFIVNIPALLGNEWTGDRLPRPPWAWGDGKRVKALVSYIAESLEEIQGDDCIYCGMPFSVTSSYQVEHIAPKGPGRYPEFTFEPANLVLACSLCNGFEKKERAEYWDTIDVRDPVYENCTFKIVHPYFDNPEEELSLDYLDKKVIIKAISIKGERTIKTFLLDEEPLTTARGKIVRLHELELKDEAENLAKLALAYKGR